MNNDTIAAKGWLARLIRLAESDESFGLLNPLGRGHEKTNLSPDQFSDLISKNSGKYTEVSQAMGHCMFIKREVLGKAGFLDEEFGMGGYDGTDYSRRAYKLGYKCIVAQDAYVYHFGNPSFKVLGKQNERLEKNKKIYLEKWSGFYRILYLVVNPDLESMVNHVNTSLGLAREWHWVHFWVYASIDTRRSYEELEKKLEIPEHQNLRKFFFTSYGLNKLSKRIFLFKLLFSLIARNFKNKGKKQFNFILTDDLVAAKLLSRFKRVVRIPVYFEVNSIHIAKKINRSALKNIEAVLATDKEIIEILNKIEADNKTVLLPYGITHFRLTKDEKAIREFERFWLTRSRKIIELAKKKIFVDNV